MSEKGVTSREEDYSSWYSDIVLKTGLADYAPVRGCMVIRPYGFALWEAIQSELDRRIKTTGIGGRYHQNAYFPLLIPKSLLAREAEHIEGFAPECAVVTHGGGKPLEEPLYIRPTSETIMYTMFAKWISSWRDLPLLINQWANIVRWELRTRLFLRTLEFLWQEGHTAHATHEEAQEECLMVLNEIYRNFAENVLAVPVIAGRKSERQKFAGAVTTYTIEGLMQDCKALQMGTSHDLGQNFSKPFEVRFQDEKGELRYVWQTSWGVSTRLIGAVIMAHSDNKGLVLPPKVAPMKAVIVPIYKSGDEKEKVLTEASKLKEILKSSVDLLSAPSSIYLDDRDQYKPGFKFAEWELRGVPLRIEIGPRDIERGKVTLVRRDTGERQEIPKQNLLSNVKEILDEIQKNLFEKALCFRKEHTFRTEDYEEFKRLIENDSGFVYSPWCGGSECEDKVQEDTKATVRCIPLESEEVKGAKCIVCGKPAKFSVPFAKAY
jgi:prolyl-tRNA synthetase